MLQLLGHLKFIKLMLLQVKNANSLGLTKFSETRQPNLIDLDAMMMQLESRKS
jgi:hypothetical protein